MVIWDLVIVRGPAKSHPLDLQDPCTDGGAHDPIKIIVGDDLFVTQIENQKMLFIHIK